MNSLSVNSRSVRWDSVMCRRTIVAIIHTVFSHCASILTVELCGKTFLPTKRGVFGFVDQYCYFCNFKFLDALTYS